MSYKLPITKEKFLEATTPKKKKDDEKQLIMRDVSGAEDYIKNPLNGEPLSAYIISKIERANKNNGANKEDNGNKIPEGA